jgi:long-chain acyl-CoA synthetase
MLRRAEEWKNSESFASYAAASSRRWVVETITLDGATDAFVIKPDANPSHDPETNFRPVRRTIPVLFGIRSTCIEMARANLTTLFAEFARFAKDVAVVQRRGYRRESWTYAQLMESAAGCAVLLRERGVRTGERVILWGPNSFEWMAAFWGCLLRGAVAVPLDDGATIEFAARVARETNARLVFASRGKPEIQSESSAIATVVLDDVSHAMNSPLRADTSDYTRLADELVTRNHIAEILFTSGTTAEPRGVVLTHGNFLANLEPLEKGIDPYRKYEKWIHPLRFVSLVPLSHVFGQVMALFVPPLLGATTVYEPSTNPSEIIRTIKRERATALIAVPRMLDGLHAGIEHDFEAAGQKAWLSRVLDAVQGQKFLRRAWRFRRIHRRFGWKFWAFISGGAAMTPGTEEFFRRIGYAVVQGYGMTETASLISLNHPFRAAQGSIGKVLPGREFRLAEDGEILVRGENVSAGYWQGGGLQTVGSESWLPTGDVGELDAEGNLKFRGRKKNVIVTPAGLNVYPGDLEQALRQQADVKDCVVVAIDRGGNAEPCAVLLMQHGGNSAEANAGAATSRGNETAERAIEKANASLAEYQRMRSWIVWPDADFPRTPTGKPRLGAITASAMQMLAGDRSGGIADATQTGASQSGPGRADGLGALLQKFSAAQSASGVSGQQLESQLNLSSLDRVELMSAIEERYQVELNETQFTQAKTVADIENLLQTPSARRTDFVYPLWTLSAPMRWIRLGVYYALVWPATQFFGHPRIVGEEHLRELRGPILVVSNHITRRDDSGLIMFALPTRYRHMLATAVGGETLQMMRHPPREWFFGKRWAYQIGYLLMTALFTTFPLPQNSGFRESFRFAGAAIDRGYSVLVFPEGHGNDTETGAMDKFQSGVGLLAENLNVPIVPMRIDGVWKMRREGRRIAKRGEIVIRIGSSVRFAPGTPPGEVANRLRQIITEL